MAVNVTLSLALVSAQVKVMSAVKSDEDKETEIKTVCAGDGDTEHPPAKVNARYRCSYVALDGTPCGREHSSYHPYPRGRDNGDGTWTVIPKEDLDAAKAGEDKSVFDSLKFVPVDRIEFERDMVPSGKVYYLQPKGAVLPYAAIREGMRLSPGDAFVTEWAYRTAVNVVRAVVMGDVIAIQQYAWQDAVLPKPVVPPAELDDSMLAMVKTIIDGLRIEWNPSSFTDTRKSKIAALIAEAAGETVTPGTSSDATQLMAELAAYLDAEAKKAAPKRKAPAKRTTKKKEVAA